MKPFTRFCVVFGIWTTILGIIVIQSSSGKNFMALAIGIMALVAGWFNEKYEGGLWQLLKDTFCRND